MGSALSDYLASNSPDIGAGLWANGVPQDATPANSNATPTAAPTAPKTITPPPPVIVPKVTAPGGALDQGIDLTNRTAGAGTAQVVNNPIIQQYLDAEAHKNQVNAAAADQLDAKNREMAAVADAPLPAHAALPTLAPITKETDDPAYAAAAKANPIKTLGMFLPILAAFGGTKTKNFAEGALIAATGALNGAETANEAQLKQAHEAWLDNTKAAIDNNAQMVAEYRMAADDRALSMADRTAKMAGIAAKYGDVVGAAALRAGDPAGILRVGEMTLKAGEHIDVVVQEAQKEAQAAAEREDANAREWTALQIRQQQVDQAAGKASPNDVVGRIIARAATLPNGYNDLTPAEKDAIKRATAYQLKIHQGQGSMFSGGADDGSEPSGTAPPKSAAAIAAQEASDNRTIDQVTGPTAQPPPAPAAPAPAAPAAAPASPALFAPSEATLNARVAGAKAALARGASRATVKSVWVQEGLPAAEFDKRVK